MRLLPGAARRHEAFMNQPVTKTGLTYRTCFGHGFATARKTVCSYLKTRTLGERAFSA